MSVIHIKDEHAVASVLEVIPDTGNGDVEKAFRFGSLSDAGDCEQGKEEREKEAHLVSLRRNT